MPLLRNLTRWYARLLSWLLAASVAILIFPVSLQSLESFLGRLPYPNEEQKERMIEALRKAGLK